MAGVRALADRTAKLGLASLAACLAWSWLAGAQTATMPFDPASPPVQAQAQAAARLPAALPPPGHSVVEDTSGRRQVGRASVYASGFQGRKMADGMRFRHTGAAAASRTLPLGTVAKVTNLQTGRSAVVTVEDHGPFVNGRTVDVSKATAGQLGITHRDGVAPVEVAPIAVPQPSGAVKPGAGAVHAPP